MREIQVGDRVTVEGSEWVWDVYLVGYTLAFLRANGFARKANFSELTLVTEPAQVATIADITDDYVLMMNAGDLGGVEL